MFNSKLYRGVRTVYIGITTASIVEGSGSRATLSMVTIVCNFYPSHEITRVCSKIYTVATHEHRGVGVGLQLATPVRVSGLADANYRNSSTKTELQDDKKTRQIHDTDLNPITLTLKTELTNITCASVMLRAGIVCGGNCVCVCLCVRLSAQSLENYWSEVDVTWWEYELWWTLKVVGS